MNDKQDNQFLKKNNILVVPLDWGLGHATRCIPIIQTLLENNCKVYIAAETATRSLLETEFPQCNFLPIKGYRIRYSRQKYFLPIKMAIQLPRILLRSFQEHRWLKKVVHQFSIDAVIADNRFGLFHSEIPSVYITHQLLIKTGNRFSEKIIQKIHGWIIKKYTHCWVPDFEGNENIAGELSHPTKSPANVKYLGCLSRLSFVLPPIKKYDLLLLLSGPEPQRTIFEKLLLSQLKNFDGKGMLVRGLPKIDEEKKNEGQIFKASSLLTIENHLSAAQLNEVILQSELVICRSGYTTIMDLIKIGKKAILVPTPGQTEQEYLADHLMKKKYFYFVTQQGFDLSDSLRLATDFNFVVPNFDMDQYKKVVNQFVQSL
jgi:predicted glycosyltransferase